jgi:hypothetical protein
MEVTAGGVDMRLGDHMRLFYPGWVSFHSSNAAQTLKAWNTWEEALNYANFEAVMEGVKTRV